MYEKSVSLLGNFVHWLRDQCYRLPNNTEDRERVIKLVMDLEPIYKEHGEIVELLKTQREIDSDNSDFWFEVKISEDGR